MANSRERLASVLYTLIAALFLGLLISEYRRAAKAHGAAHSSLNGPAGRDCALAQKCAEMDERTGDEARVHGSRA